MAYKSCENCGCRVYNGFCTNCDEESCIEMFQGEFIESRSDEWMEKLSEQEDRARIRRLKDGES